MLFHRSSKKLDRDELRINVDLDEEEGKPSRANGKHIVFVRWTRKVDFYGLNAFLSGSASWSAQCIDTVNFLDHVLREGPSQKYTQIKKSFFQRGEQRFDLGGGVEAFKGVFASLRPVLNDQLKASLSINVDVANGTFWRAQELTRAVQQVFGCNLPQFIQRVTTAKADWKNSHMKRDLGRFKRVGVTAFHNQNALTQWTIAEIVPKDCYEASFPDPDSPGRNISLFQYYRTKYNITLSKGLPVVKVTKKIRKSDVFLPMEYLKIDPNQRYNTKLSDVQTSQMIKFAVTLPAERRKAVEFGVRLLDWPNDRYMAQYGIKVSPTPSRVKARILPSPAVGFGPQSKPNLVPERDLVQGRWRLDGKLFMAANQREITAWGVCCIAGRNPMSKEQVMAFVNNFIRIYESHGGRFSTRFKKQPYGKYYLSPLGARTNS
jgi:eukaryotic translation initiation factor 2C